MQELLVSVIVPVYNVENYVNECIDSILQQKYENIEVIIVDDGSTDGSGSICDHYGEYDERVIVIHKQNGGLSDARNTGLNSSSGEYITFVDSDDYIHKDMIFNLMNAIVSSGSDCAVCPLVRFEDGMKTNQNVFFNSSEAETLSGYQLVKELYMGKYGEIGLVAPNKVYKRSLFVHNKIQYPVGRFHEDTFTTFKLIYNSSKVSIVPQPMYYYRVRSGSIMNSSIDIKKCSDGIEGDYSSVEYFNEKNEDELKKLCLNNFYRSQIKTYYKISKDNDCKKLLINRYKKIWRQYGYKGNLIKCMVYFSFMFIPGAVSKIVKHII